MSTVILSSKGQIVIPKEIRNRLGLEKGSRLKINVMEGHFIVKPAREDEKGWRRWRGALKGTRALEEHVEEHRREVRKDE